MLSGIDIEALLGRGDAREPDAGRSKDVTSFWGPARQRCVAVAKGLQLVHR